jgi:hypothetical protein
VLVVVVVLAVVAAAALAGLGYAGFRLVQPPEPGRVPRAPDGTAAAALDRSPRPAGASADTRRLISIEILNPIELAGTRHRLLGIAGSLAPGLTRRVVYDQVLRIIKQQLDEQHVVADVRLHTLRPAPAADGAPVDEVRRVDLGALDEPDEPDAGDAAKQARR